jgi:hypothetical protein
MHLTSHAAMIMWRTDYSVRGAATINRLLVAPVDSQIVKRHHAAACPEPI